MLDTLIMRGVAGHEFQSLIDRDRGYYWVGSANGLANTFEVAGNASGKISDRRIQGKDLFRGDRCYERIKSLKLLSLLVPTHDLKYGDRG